MRAAVLGFATGIASAILAIATGAQLADARPLTPAEQRFIPYSAQLPHCAAEGVLSTIQSRFRERESRYWKSGLDIDGFDKIRETAFRKNGLDYIPRRYCQARVLMNDRKLRTIVYSIGEDLNMTGGDAVRSVTQSLTFGLLPDLNLSPFENWGVDWCITGLDRNYAFGLNCKAARP